ncbi:hypothetical protein CEXT_577621, partial [Caerostris extrusa]
MFSSSRQEQMAAALQSFGSLKQSVGFAQGRGK